MSLTSYDGQFSFKQDSLARLGQRDTKKMSATEYQAFQNSPFMQAVRKCEDLCWKFTGTRDQERSKRDPTFKPVDDDFSAPKAHGYDRAINYYKVLGVDEYAPLDEVKKAYKKLSLVYHPDKTTGLSEEQREEYAGIFIELKNAYLTLGDQATRRQYDRDRDKDRASFEIQGFKPKTRAHFDASEMLRKLQEMQKPPGRIVDVPVSAKLEKFFYGGHKKIKRSRRVKDFDGFTTETRLYRVDIPRGAAEPYECAFRKQGDHNNDTQPDTLNFRISAKPHEVVQRQGADLVARASVYLGKEALEEPFVSAEAPSVRGRHLLLWGRNPFFACPGVTAGNLRVRIKGEGLAADGALVLACRLGEPAATRPAGAAAAGASSGYPGGLPGRSGGVGRGDKVMVTVRHMQTEAKIWLLVPRSATMSDIRAKIMLVLGLPRGSTVRLLQQIAGGFTPYPDRQPINGLTTLNCAGTAWHGVVFTQEPLRQLLEGIVAVMDTQAFRADFEHAKLAYSASLSAGVQAKAALQARLAEVLPEFGCEASLAALAERLAQARADLAGSAAAQPLLARVEALERLGDEAPAARPRRSPKRFLQRFGLGPPEGFDGPGSETEDEAQARGAAADSGDAAMAPAMLRRAARRQVAERVCELELQQVGEPLTLFSRPTCSVTFYSNARQATGAPPGVLPPRPMFAISVSSSSCAKKGATREWEALKAGVVPLLRTTGFHLLRAARAIRPRALANAPAFEQDGREAGAVASAAAAAEEIDFLACGVQRASETSEERRLRCEEAKREKAVFLSRSLALEHRSGSSSGTAWKKVGDDAFRRGDFYSGIRCYSRCLADLELHEYNRSLEGLRDEGAQAKAPEGELAKDVAVILSNRSACLSKVRHFHDALADARSALALRPAWGRAWGRVGLAASALGRVEEAIEAFIQAVAFEPSAANVSALADAAGRKARDPDGAHVAKEMGNGARRVGDHGLAVAQYTYSMGLLPSDPKLIDPNSGGDDHTFLRAVLFCNRAAAFCCLKNWELAFADAQRAVIAKGDFAKGHCRLGTAMLGLGQNEKAYAEFARALVLEANDATALKGRQACISLLPFWTSQAARRRHHSNFSADLARPSGSTKVYAISDVHFDHKCNEEWAHRIDDFKFQEDVLIVAGNMCDTSNALRRGLTTLKSKFRRVFYVPGNHELWIHPSESTKFADSFAKLVGLLEICDEVNIDVFPAAVCQDVFVVPMFSWYTSEFDSADPFPDPSSKVDQHCRWPIPDTQVWKYMMKLNNVLLGHPFHSTVISFSHFLPNAGLPFPTYGSQVKTMGCEQLDEQVRALRGSQRVHVYGHSPRRHHEQLDGITYVNHYHGEDGGKSERSPVLMVYNGSRAVAMAEDIYDGPRRL